MTENQIISSIKDPETKFLEIRDFLLTYPQTYGIQRAAVERHSILIRYMEKFPEDITNMALKNDYRSIGCIKNPSEIECFIAITEHPESIQFIDNPSEELCLQVLNKDSTCLKFIKNQTVDFCLKAMELSAWNYAYVKIVDNPDYETTKNNLMLLKEKNLLKLKLLGL